MKVFQRVLVKTVILVLVIAAAGGGSASWQAKRQSTPEYAVDHYLSLLIENSADKAFGCLDQSDAQYLTKKEYEGALTEKKYSLYASFDISELEKRRDNNGNEYADYEVQFKNAADEVQMEEIFTVKKQPERIMGIFDRWKVLSTHCMVKNFVLKVPAGSAVYLDAVQADPSWIVRDEAQTSVDSYQIPNLIPGKTALVIRHPALESVNGTLNALDKSADYTDKMPLKESAKKECTELGVKFLKAVYVSSAKNKTEDPENLLKECQKTADELIKNQGEVFHKEEASFRNAAISGFAPKFGELVFQDEKGGALSTVMTFPYHYVVREDRMEDTGEILEDGTSVQEMETKEQAGDATAKLTMSFYDGAWHITEVDMQVIPVR